MKKKLEEEKEKEEEEKEDEGEADKLKEQSELILLNTSVLIRIIGFLSGVLQFEGGKQDWFDAPLVSTTDTLAYKRQKCTP